MPVKDKVVVEGQEEACGSIHDNIFKMLFGNVWAIDQVSALKCETLYIPGREIGHIP